MEFTRIDTEMVPESLGEMRMSGEKVLLH
jgi:hypothetical protein